MPFSIKEVYDKTSCTTPIFFVLFPGVDPTADVEKIGTSLNKKLIDGTFINISMGQGQEERALNLLQKCSEEGNWIFLQNVHLMSAWLKDFERKLEVVT